MRQLEVALAFGEPHGFVGLEEAPGKGVDGEAVEPWIGEANFERLSFAPRSVGA